MKNKKCRDNSLDSLITKKYFIIAEFFNNKFEKFLCGSFDFENALRFSELLESKKSKFGYSYKIYCSVITGIMFEA